MLTLLVGLWMFAVPRADAQSPNRSQVQVQQASTKSVATKPASASKAKAAPARKANASPSRKASPTRKGPVRKKKRVVRRAPPRPSVAQLQGLRKTEDPLDLKSSVALVVDQDTQEVLFSKNPNAVLPIASITKLMTALVVADAGLPLGETLLVSRDDVRATSASRARSRLLPGTRLSRGEMMHLALMSSDNRAAHVLGRTYPGGMRAFVAAMNQKAAALGMGDTRYVEPTGLSADNRSSAQDLARLVSAASGFAVIRELSTSLQAVLPVGTKKRPTQFRNTNGLVHNPEWEIGLQKTGFISAAGRCVVMQAQLAGRSLIMVLLDSAGRYTRIGDAERLRAWVSEQQFLPSFSPALPALEHTLPQARSAVRPLAASHPLVLSTPAVGPAAAPELLKAPAVGASHALPGPPALRADLPSVYVPALPLTLSGEAAGASR
jgi:serine-type D-Ala-D-Ala endopeptidase (penicillin-binding protein 7)